MFVMSKKQRPVVTVTNAAIGVRLFRLEEFGRLTYHERKRVLGANTTLVLPALVPRPEDGNGAVERQRLRQ